MSKHSWYRVDGWKKWHLFDMPASEYLTVCGKPAFPWQAVNCPIDLPITETDAWIGVKRAIGHKFCKQCVKWLEGNKDVITTKAVE